MSKKYNWELSLEEFKSKTKAIRIANRYEDYYRLGKMHTRGYTYYLYLDPDLNTINPFTKKDENKGIIHRFRSECRDQVIEDCYKWMIAYAKREGLFEI